MEKTYARSRELDTADLVSLFDTLQICVFACQKGREEEESEEEKEQKVEEDVTGGRSRVLLHQTKAHLGTLRPHSTFSMIHTLLPVTS
jgi:hypothetical protein